MDVIFVNLRLDGTFVRNKRPANGASNRRPFKTHEEKEHIYPCRSGGFGIFCRSALPCTEEKNTPNSDGMPYIDGLVFPKAKPEKKSPTHLLGILTIRVTSQ